MDVVYKGLTINVGDNEGGRGDKRGSVDTQIDRVAEEHTSLFLTSLKEPRCVDAIQVDSVPALAQR